MACQGRFLWAVEILPFFFSYYFLLLSFSCFFPSIFFLAPRQAGLSTFACASLFAGFLDQVARLRRFFERADRRQDELAKRKGKGSVAKGAILLLRTEREKRDGPKTGPPHAQNRAPSPETATAPTGATKGRPTGNHKTTTDTNDENARTEHGGQKKAAATETTAATKPRPDTQQQRERGTNRQTQRGDPEPTQRGKRETQPNREPNREREHRNDQTQHTSQEKAKKEKSPPRHRNGHNKPTD